jgi:hypothetical protein
MTPRARNEESIGSPSWMKRLSRIWHIENIKVVRRVIVSVIGVTVLLIGLAPLVLPAFIVIPVGLVILATEYAWARRWLKKSSSNGERRCFWSRSYDIPKYYCLVSTSQCRGLIKTCL